MNHFLGRFRGFRYNACSLIEGRISINFANITLKKQSNKLLKKDI